MAAIGLTLVALFSETALAQCAMCRTALEQNSDAAVGFNRGIVFLLGMPYLVFAAIGGSWYWNRRKRLSRKGAPVLSTVR